MPLLVQRSTCTASFIRVKSWRTMQAMYPLLAVTVMPCSLAHAQPAYSVTPVLFVPDPASYPPGYAPTQQQLAADQANITEAMSRIRTWYAAALGLTTTFQVQPLVYMPAFGGLSAYDISWTDPARRYDDGITLGNTWGKVLSEVRARGYTPGTSSSPRIIVVFCKGAGGFAGGATWFNATGGGMCMLGDWCIDSLAERVPGPDWDWWTGKDKQTGAAAHEIGHTIGLPHPDALNPDTGANDYPYTLMGAWWDWPNHPFHPADPDWPLRGLHAWADNTGPSGAGAHPDYQDEFLLTYHLAWFHNSVADSDEDGLPDSWEVQYFGDLSHVAATDEEPDGLINVDEVSYATHPLLADTDGDTLSDGDEIFVHGSDPTMMDTDSDGLDDADEVMLGTDPALADSDADGLPDGWEVANSLDPLANDADDDPDQDGYTNAEEFGGGTHPQLPWSIPAVPGFALAFDGADDHADFGNVVVSGATLTVEAWVMPQQSGSARVLEKLEDFGVQFTAGNVVRFLTRHGFTWHVLDGQSQNPTGEWMHIACVLDGTMKRIYVNGELDASAAYTFDVKITSNPLIIGASSPLADQGFFAGMIDEIRVWNIPRTQTQITEGMNAATPPATLGLVGYWPLDEGAGQFPMDLAGSHSGRLGTTSTEDASDPLWTASGVAPGLGPTVDSLLTPSHVPVGSMLTVTVDLSDAATGDDGVDSARLCYDYDWPFNANSVAGTGPGGNGDGTWSFTIPARSPDDAGNTLYFFIQATDHAGHSTFALDGDAPYAVLISRSGDQDADGDVDAVDYASFVGCLNGPGSPAPGCASFDFDANGAIDLADYAGFQRVLDLP